MKKLVLVISVFIMLMFVYCFNAKAEEGMYLIHNIPPQVMQEMKGMGFELSPYDIFSMTEPSLAQAVINLGGGTASFVSTKGLILTNHHVAFSAAQRQSSIDSNLIENGFIAQRIEDEIPALGYRAMVLEEVKDVTNEVLQGVNKNISPQQIIKLVEKNIKKIIKREEGKSSDYKCEIKSVYGGLYFYLYKYFHIKDIRIVYIPPRNIGEFGGEIDNWMWPRHTGDFSFMRAYVSLNGKTAEYSKENVPYVPKRYLKFSARDIDEGDFAIVIGYPGTTERHLISEEVDYFINYYYPQGIKFFAKLIEILEDEAKKESDAAIKNASLIKGFSNAYKNFQGMTEGFKKVNIIEKKKQQEEELMRYIENKFELKSKYSTVLSDLVKIVKEQKSILVKERMIRALRMSSRLLGAALVIDKWSIEKQKKDIERELGYMERDIPDLKLSLSLIQKILHIPSDKRSLAFALSEALKLDGNEKIRALDKFIKDKTDVGINAFVDSLYENTKLADENYRIKLFDTPRKELFKLNDALINFADALQQEIDELNEMSKAIEGKMLFVRPKYMEALIMQQEGNIYPDANRTPRLTYGTIAGYSVKDAIVYLPQTSLKGVIEKDTGQFPFNVPASLKILYQEKDFGGYIDPKLNDVPVNFLTNNYCTGGNSGSPIINKHGELIGTVFDINYESLVSDYYFLSDITRTISVDSRYILFILDKVSSAQNLLDELEVVK